MTFYYYDNSLIQLDTIHILTSAARLTRELQANVTQLQQRIDHLVDTVSTPDGLPIYLPLPPPAAIETMVLVAPALIINFRQTYIDALDNWTLHMRDALQTYELVVKGLAQDVQLMVDLDKGDVIALPAPVPPAPSK